MALTPEARRTPTAWLALALLASTSGALRAQAPEPADEGRDGDTFGATGVTRTRSRADPGQATSVVTRREIEERLPRSAPDALRYEPGVSIQQTAHGQASPFVRGMTGQQVAHVFDGVRINNGIFRQGPNQYFFTIDAHTLERLEVVRGSASTRHGSDALGGAILAYPRRPGPGGPDGTPRITPRVFARFASADAERGGRAELDLALPGGTGLLVGGGHRRTGRLTSGGLVANPGRLEPLVPRFEADGRTQLGTGFEETTFDLRVEQRVRPTVRAVGAVYGYRQGDAPRTDQCPPPEAPVSECLRITEQFRTLALVALRGSAGRAMADFDLNASYQRHDEQRVNERPLSMVESAFDNSVDTLGASFQARTDELSLGGLGVEIAYGADAYRDRVGSTARQELLDPELRDQLGADALVLETRGQYVDGARYISAGAFSELTFRPAHWLTARSGGRVAAIGAGAGTLSQRWATAVGRAGVELTLHPEHRVFANFDQGFRAANLDDLTSRQQVGPGFQFENEQLEPERTNTVELGLASTPSWLTLELWLFATWLDDGIIRAVREQSDCPAEADACRSSRTQFQLVNADGTALILGTEGGITLWLPEDLTLRATLAFAHGEGPNTGSRSTGGETPFGDRVPLSRIPPLNGTVELRYVHAGTGLYFAAVNRWAAAQRRLAPSDLSDARIPIGGTPGYTVFDLRAGYRPLRELSLSLVMENLFDEAYRVHGSSINGPGRGIMAILRAEL